MVIMRKFSRPKRFAFLALTVLAIVLAGNSPGEARAAGGFSGGHPGGAVGHPGFAGHPGFSGHPGFNGHHGFDAHHFHRGVHGGFVFGYSPVFPDYGYYPPVGGYEAPTYWYCPSYGAYYPSVAECPDAWVPVPGS
ncbi:MAG: hypothetical protein DMD81_14425 [Candidatus Rokuibacteriota bacterium]|nr:MAG: hypothetical protein DMD81_14425 [Candidatus Rokubacteria bacterium]